MRKNKNDFEDTLDVVDDNADLMDETDLFMDDEMDDTDDTDSVMHEIRSKAAHKAETFEHTLSSREVAAIRSKKRKRKTMTLVLCIVGAVVLAVGGYFGANIIIDKTKTDNMNEQISALANVGGFASYTEFETAINAARNEYNALPADLRGKIDASVLTTSEEMLTRVKAMQEKLNTLPTDIPFVGFEAQKAAIVAMRTEFDALAENDKLLIDSAPLTAAEALVTSLEAQYAPVIALNASIAAFSVGEESTKANIDKAIADLAQIKNALAAATFDTTNVDTASLTAKEAQLNTLISGYSSKLTGDGQTIIAKLKEASGINSKITTLIKGITLVEGATEGAAIPVSKIKDYAASYDKLMEQIVTLIKSADMFNVVPGYTDKAVTSAQKAIGKMNEGVKYAQNTVILDQAQLSTLLGYFTSASRYSTDVSVAVGTVNSGLKTYLEGIKLPSAGNNSTTPTVSPTPTPKTDTQG